MRKIHYSPGYGAGWTTWHLGDEAERKFMLEYAPLIAFLEGGGKDLDPGYNDVPEEKQHPVIQQFLRDRPAEGRDMLRANQSYVFFRETTGAGPVGALGVPVKARSTVAVDPAFVPTRRRSHRQAPALACEVEELEDVVDADVLEWSFDCHQRASCDARLLYLRATV